MMCFIFMKLQRMETDAFRILKGVIVTRVLYSKTFEVIIVLRQGWT